jgi:hypothetical protein
MLASEKYPLIEMAREMWRDHGHPMRLCRVLENRTELYVGNISVNVQVQSNRQGFSLLAQAVDVEICCNGWNLPDRLIVYPRPLLEWNQEDDGQDEPAEHQGKRTKPGSRELGHEATRCNDGQQPREQADGDLGAATVTQLSLS